MAPLDILPAWPSGLRRCNFPVVDWRGVGSNPAGDIYFHFEFFAPSLFRTGQRSRCKWNQACPFTWSHSCFRPQIWFIIQGLVYKYLQYSFNDDLGSTGHCYTIWTWKSHYFVRVFVALFHLPQRAGSTWYSSPFKSGLTQVLPCPLLLIAERIYNTFWQKKSPVNSLKY